MSKKIFLSPENSDYKGVYLTDGSFHSEKVYCREMATLIKAKLENNGFEVFIGETKDNIYTRADWANNNGIDYYLPIHTNAGGGTGTEMLYYNHASSIKANQLVYDELIKLYPSKRGLKDYSNFVENRNTNMVSCYVEIAFHDNDNDRDFLINNKDEIATAISKGVCAYWGVTYNNMTTSTDSDTNEILEEEIRKMQETINFQEEQIDIYENAVSEIQSIIDKM